MITGFEPVVPAAARVLILGSMPGVRSLDDQQYYAHPQNQFWRLMSLVLGESAPQDYDAKLALLARHGIALWDVLAACDRAGSLDSAIRNEQPNDIAALLQRETSLHTVILNGRKADSSFQKHVRVPQGISVVVVPSSSAANARLSFEDKCVRWAVIQRALRP